MSAARPDGAAAPADGAARLAAEAATPPGVAGQPAAGPARSPGRLWVVGVGPGDPELVTVRAARLIGEADVVCYPRPCRVPSDGEPLSEGDSMAAGRDALHPAGGLPPPRLHARDIAALYLREDQRELAFDLPMSADSRVADAAYATAAERIGTELDAGRRVVVLTEGDPLFFGSASRLIEALDARWPVAFVPGVASPNAAAALLGRALTRREDIYKVLAATLPDERLTTELASADAAAILKIGRHFDRVRAVCDRLGLTGRAHLVANATRVDEVVEPLATVAAGPKPYFSLILIPCSASLPGARPDSAKPAAAETSADAAASDRRVDAASAFASSG